MDLDNNFPWQAGIITEMVEDTMEITDDVEDLEEDEQTEVNKVIEEITSGKKTSIAKLPSSVEASIDLPDPEKDEVPEVADDDEIEEMQERLEALRS